jgi:hypothetical protein
MQNPTACTPSSLLLILSKAARFELLLREVL